MYELNMGATVHCTDGQCGHLTKLVLEPDTYIVTHIVVEEGLLFKMSQSLSYFCCETNSRTGYLPVYLGGTDE